MTKLTFMPFYKTNGIQLNTIDEGPKDAPIILLLHGFPEFSFGWRKQINFFSKSGYRVIAPDQRGYNLSDKPKGIRSYMISELMKDVVGLLEQVQAPSPSKKPVYLIGHDWGAAVAWSLATFYPALFQKVVILNVPHPVVMMQEMNFRQMLRSWYIFFFQIPKLPEWILSQNRFAMIARSLLKSSLPKTFSPEDIEQYRKAWSNPGALTGMINWYRALRYKDHLPHAPNQISLPLLILWGKKDAFLGAHLAQASLEKCTQGKLVYFDDATHWIHLEKSNEVNSAILDFISIP